jgi:hypothetical protein
METITMQLGGLSNHQHVAENLELPIIPELGAVTTCRKAIDLCAASRIGLGISGPKGSGKSVGLDLGYDWFARLERAMQARDNAYTVRRVLRLRAVGSKTDREVILILAKHLTRTYSDRAGGRKKGVPEIRADVLEMCQKRQYALIVADEAETYGESALECLRDLLADSQDGGTGRVRETGTVAKGIGLLLVGDEKLRHRLGGMTEASHRWRQVIDVNPIEPAQVAGVYATWFPGFAPHVASIGEDVWQNYAASVACRRTVSFRFLENHARLYAHYMVRKDAAITGRERIPFDRHIFELAADECAWGAEAAPASSPSVRRKTQKKGAAR